MELAIQHHQAGRLAEAEALYRQILAVEPRHADALHLCGVIAAQSGRPDVAVDLIRRAIALAPGVPAFHSNLGEAHRVLRQLDEAIAAYRQAIALSANYPEAHNNLGNVLRDKGRLDEAIAACRQAIALSPNLSEAHNNLGNALYDKGELVEAIAAYRRAISLRPNFGEPYNNLSNALREKGKLDEAIAACRHAITLSPNLAEAHSSLGNALKDEARLGEAITAFRRALQVKPDDAIIHSNLIYTLHFDPAHSVAAIREEHRRWERQFGEPLRKSHRPYANAPDPARRLKIGYVSPNLLRHVIHHFLLPLLEAHDHAAFEIYCYASVKRPDAVTERMKKSADVWRDVLGMSDEALAERIRADGIDILVDLTQHMADNRLPVFARKPAPVQVAWLGYPGSTGLSAMDYRITDAWMEPEGAAWSESVEQVVRLPDSWFCFDPVDEYPEPMEPPALKAGHVTFGCLNAFCKVNDAVLEQWAKVIHAVADSRLLMRCPQGEVQSRVREFFAARGIAAERLELVAWMPTRADFLKVFERMDIVLDPFPYNGGTTTCEALWMGIPVLTLPGERIVSRIGMSILMACGMPEFIAHTEEDYVRLAMSLAADLPRLAALRSTLRARMKASAFMDSPRFAKNVEHAYRAMWRAWCGRQSPRVS